MNISSTLPLFNLKGKTIVYIDWANVYGWFSDSSQRIEPQKLFNYLKTYEEIEDIRFYFGLDKHPKSKAFLECIKNMGYTVITKDVKKVPVTLDQSYFKTVVNEINEFLNHLKQKFIELTRNMDEESEILQELDAQREKLQQTIDTPVFRRKCDFDCEIVMDILENLERIDGVILFSGDGDYANIIKNLIEKQKQVIIIFSPGHLGKEFHEIKRGLFLCPVKRIKKYVISKKYPGEPAKGRSTGRD